MSARPSLFVCAALLAALLAPQAAAKPSPATTRDSAQHAPAAPSARPNTRSGKSTAPATKAAATGSSGEASRAAGAAGSPDMVKKPGKGAAAGVRSDTRAATATKTRAAAVEKPRSAKTGRRADVIDGRDAAALRALYRKRRAEPATRPTARPQTGGARAEASGPREARAVEAPTPSPSQPAAREPAPAVARTGVPSDMAKKTGPKKQRRKAGDDDEVVAAASGPATSGCAAGLSAAPALQFDRTRATLREFSWADMAYFFETAADEAEPEPRQVGREGTLPAEEAIRRSGLPRKTLEGLAHARSVDLLTERELARIDRALSGASPAAIATLLQADSPSLRAHVWTWLATTPSGACALVKLDGREVDAAIRDRSVAVEHGEDLVFRPLGDYALAARTRVAAADPQAFDALLRSLGSDPAIDPRVRALVAGLRVRRGHADSIEEGLRDPAASVRGATAAAAIDRDRARYEGRMLDHAADDPADLVTELIVGELLGGPDGAPRGELAQRRDERVMAAVSRWRGKGDPLAPLPVPSQPLRFSPVKNVEPTPAPAPVIAAAPEPAPEPAPTPEPEAPAAVEARPLAHTPTRREAEAPAGPRLPSVLDEPEGSLRP